MRYCHACHAQLPDEARRCLHCGGPLRDRPPSSAAAGRGGGDGPEAGHAEGRADRGRERETEREPEDAEERAEEGASHLLARREPRNARPLLEALRAAGVPFRVLGEGGTDRVQAVHGGGGRYAAIEVYVAPEDLPAAEAVVREELRALAGGLPGSGTESDRCPACGYALAADAPACPDCGLVFRA